MKISVPKGKYIVAVSGGVDSMTLLYLLSEIKHQDIEFIVAHFNHGIREDSEKDQKLVEKMANHYGFVIETLNGHLGNEASEEEARNARLNFLKNSKDKYKADKIITAHHKDDLIETALINILRGSGRRGINALISSDNYIRPLVNYSKSEILDYAKTNKIEWHEDYTNQETKYLRNYLRHNILSSLGSNEKEKLASIISDQNKLNKEIDLILDSISSGKNLDRQLLNTLDHDLIKEVIIAWLRKNNIFNYDKALINRITIETLVFHPGKTITINKNTVIKVTKNNLALDIHERY